VCGAQLIVTDPNQQQRIINVDALFNPAESITKDAIILQIRIPHPKPNQVVFFDKQARRKTAELAVANMAISAEVKAEKLTSVKVALGGVAAALKECQDRAVPNAVHLADLLMENGLAASKEQIHAALQQDLANKQESKIDQYRIGVFISFVQKFISQLESTNQMPDKKNMKGDTGRVADPYQ